MDDEQLTMDNGQLTIIQNTAKISNHIKILLDVGANCVRPQNRTTTEKPTETWRGVM